MAMASLQMAPMTPMTPVQSATSVPAAFTHWALPGNDAPPQHAQVQTMHGMSGAPPRVVADGGSISDSPRRHTPREGREDRKRKRRSPVSELRRIESMLHAAKKSMLMAGGMMQTPQQHTMQRTTPYYNPSSGTPSSDISEIPAGFRSSMQQALAAQGFNLEMPEMPAPAALPAAPVPAPGPVQSSPPMRAHVEAFILENDLSEQVAADLRALNSISQELVMRPLTNVRKPNAVIKSRIEEVCRSGAIGGSGCWAGRSPAAPRRNRDSAGWESWRDGPDQRRRGPSAPHGADGPERRRGASRPRHAVPGPDGPDRQRGPSVARGAQEEQEPYRRRGLSVPLSVPPVGARARGDRGERKSKWEDSPKKSQWEDSEWKQSDWKADGWNQWSDEEWAKWKARESEKEETALGHSPETSQMEVATPLAGPAQFAAAAEPASIVLDDLSDGEVPDSSTGGDAPAAPKGVQARPPVEVVQILENKGGCEIIEAKAHPPVDEVQVSENKKDCEIIEEEPKPKRQKEPKRAREGHSAGPGIIVRNSAHAAERALREMVTTIRDTTPSSDVAVQIECHLLAEVVSRATCSFVALEFACKALLEQSTGTAGA